jgi:DNA-binding IclR family transcriptional regulator
MTDHLPNDLSHLSDAEFHSLCPQGEHAPGSAPLSPAAQAVLTAVTQQEYCLDPSEIPTEAARIGCLLSAAFRVAAAIPSASAPVPFTYKLLDIADELEGHA